MKQTNVLILMAIAFSYYVVKNLLNYIITVPCVLVYNVGLLRITIDIV